MYKKNSLRVSVLLLSGLLAGCVSQQIAPKEQSKMAFVVAHHSVLSISLPATYRWSDGFKRHSAPEVIKNVPMWELLKQGIEQEMQRKGYRQVIERAQADIDISFAAALTTTLNDQEIQEKFGLVPGLMVNPSDPKRYEKGTLVFDVINPNTGQLAWRTAGQALASLREIPMDERKAGINAFVKKLLAFLPEK